MSRLGCNEVLDGLFELVEGLSEPDERRRLEAHIDECKSCEFFLKTYKKATALCCRVLKKAPPAGASERFFAVLRDRTAQMRRR